LPPPSEAQLPVQLDEYRHTWTVTAANPNLQIAGHFANQVQPGFWAFGFVAARRDQRRPACPGRTAHRLPARTPRCPA